MTKPASDVAREFVTARYPNAEDRDACENLIDALATLLERERLEAKIEALTQSKFRNPGVRHIMSENIKRLRAQLAAKKEGADANARNS